MYVVAKEYGRMCLNSFPNISYNCDFRQCNIDVLVGTPTIQYAKKTQTINPRSAFGGIDDGPPCVLYFLRHISAALGAQMVQDLPGSSS